MVVTNRKEKREPDFLRAINRCWLLLKQAGRRGLAEQDYDLTIEQLLVLIILEEMDGQNLSDLAELADRQRATMTRMVDGLERRNLVVRVPDKTDGRIRLVYLTKHGRGLAKKVEKLRERFEEKAFEGLTKSQIAQASRILRRVSENLESNA